MASTQGVFLDPGNPFFRHVMSESSDGQDIEKDVDFTDSRKTSIDTDANHQCDYNGKNTDVQFDDQTSTTGSNVNSGDNLSDDEEGIKETLKEKSKIDKLWDTKADGEGLPVMAEMSSEDIEGGSTHSGSSSYFKPRPLTQKEVFVEGKLDAKEMDDSKDLEYIQTVKESNLTNPKTEADSTTSQFPTLSEQEAEEKLLDSDVASNDQLLENIKDIGFGNLKRLQHLDKSNPAVRRLIARPQVTVREVNNIKIDADIKSMVNYFLRNNITESFIISRVLRENYATFYSWLATHLQTERNAWAARLKQALEKMDQQRRANLDTNALLVESAAQLRNLVQMCSTAMFGISGKESKLNGIGKKDSKFNNQRTSTSPLQSNGDSAFQTRKNNFHQRLTALGRLDERVVGSNHLTQSSFNVINVQTNSKATVNYESDPGVYSSSRDFYKGTTEKTKGVFNKQSIKPRADNASLYSGKQMKDFSSKVCDNDDLCYTSGNESNNELDGVEYDDDTNWTQVMRDSIDVITEICDTLVGDRTACLDLIGVKPNKCSSLVDAVSAYAQDRHTSGHKKRREIERNLRTIETENKNLLEEMTTLQGTLTTKQNDALNLQRQLDRLEAMMNDNTNSKVHKCVGTDDLLKPKLKAHIKAGTKSPYGGDSKSPFGKPTKVKYVGPGKKVIQVDSDLDNMMPDSKQLGQEINNQKMDNGNNPIVKVVTSENNLNTLPVRQPSRERSLIEISEEKLKTLKLRARKLEDSLHDAISSMERLNKSMPDKDNASIISVASSSTAVPAFGKKLRRNNVKYWPKNPNQVNGTSTVQAIPDLILTPRLAVVNRAGCLSEKRSQSVTVPPNIALESEPSSLLSGRSVALSSHDMADRTAIPSSLRLNTDKPYGATPVSRLSQNGLSRDKDIGSRHSKDDNASNNEDYESDDKTVDASRQSRHRQEQPNTSSKKTKVISRFRQAGKGSVSKCLRCQKLFNTIDNHKLACCYHLKDKERVEHYDQSGRLVKVLHAWKCCHQPQEVEGCSYGKHV